MLSELGRAMDDAKEKINKQIDEQLLSFFGSQDHILKYGHLYVLEAEPVRMEMMSHNELASNTNTIMCQVMTKIRIRHKTLEELEQDRKD